MNYKVYLAGRYSRLEELAGYAKTLEALGFEVTSRWLKGIHGADDGDKSRWSEFAWDDWIDVASAKIVVAFTEDGRTTRGGRHVEFGMALARDKITVVVGPVENIFHTMANYRFDTWGEALETFTHLRCAFAYLQD